jgi:hypothetical protein
MAASPPVQESELDKGTDQINDATTMCNGELEQLS